MAKYKVLSMFKDTVTGEVYFPGDPYPKGGAATPERIKALSSTANAHKSPLIVAVAEPQAVTSSAEPIDPVLKEKK